MLYKIIKNGKEYEGLTPEKFTHLPLEKNLENLLADHLMNSLRLVPIFQERQRQEEADIYAINKHGDLVIFELKRDVVGDDAVHQILRYSDISSDWGYDTLQQKLNTYRKNEADTCSLQELHQEVFELDAPLGKECFNQDQHLIIVGYASSDSLVRKVDHWKQRGLNIDFLPYRIYKLGDEEYFEFFSLPYDQHPNPKYEKGVIFDTCRGGDDPDWSLRYMMENDCVAAYDEQDGAVHCLNKNDTVFLYHKGIGIVGAGRITSGVKAGPASQRVHTTKFCKIEWLTPKPNLEELKHLRASKIKELLGHGFFWARTVKVPYLKKEESQILIDEFNKL